MLELKNIVKNYYVGSEEVPALKGIDLKFRKNEFVSILGPSGCGKTTMLNLIGGLDQYTSGDLLINGTSTKEFKDKDWDSYRNSTIGFVFQNYNLISHLSILNNVEMALSLSGVSASERKERSIKALEEVGLIDHIYKRPNQLSGGQMQRVAIARALVNEPKILLCDEPTGALDTKTSVQIMKLIQEISKDKLVIMVTHNPKIANEYSSRIINLLDGEVLDDSNPVKDNELSKDGFTPIKTAMSYFSAFKTSLQNLFTKKWRTVITAVAGSIGIIGIALVLGISTGMTGYVDELESDTLSGFPITISEQAQASTVGPGNGDGGSILDTSVSDDAFTNENVVYSYNESEETTIHTNLFTDDFISYLEEMDDSYYNTITYSSGVDINVITSTYTNDYSLVEVETSNQGIFSNSTSAFNEIPNNEEFILSQYDVLAGSYLSTYNEVVLIVDDENNVDVEILEALGYEIQDEYVFEDFLGKEFSVVTNNSFYVESNGIYLENTNYEEVYNSEDSVIVTVVGVLRVTEEATSELLSVGIGYSEALTTYVLNENSISDVVITQEVSEVNVLNGMAFYDYLTKEDVMISLGGDDTPVGISIYPVGFEEKEAIKAYIDEYNETVEDEYVIIYTDVAEMISSAMTGLIDTITIILTAFAGISLVVSSIMIGIITYVSVIERTKEIGIMRSLGARKKDIRRIFTAETIIIGLTSGLLGILAYLGLQGPVNMIIGDLLAIDNFATLPFDYMVYLIVLSSALTFIAGTIPSNIAAKKDPVIALRTE